MSCCFPPKARRCDQPTVRRRPFVRLHGVCLADCGYYLHVGIHGKCGGAAGKLRCSTKRESGCARFAMTLPCVVGLSRVVAMCLPSICHVFAMPRCGYAKFAIWQSSASRQNATCQCYCSSACKVLDNCSEMQKHIWSMLMDNMANTRHLTPACCCKDRLTNNPDGSQHGDTF